MHFSNTVPPAPTLSSHMLPLQETPRIGEGLPGESIRALRRRFIYLVYVRVDDFTFHCTGDCINTALDECHRWRNEKSKTTAAPAGGTQRRRRELRNRIRKGAAGGRETFKENDRRSGKGAVFRADFIGTGMESRIIS